MGSGEMSWREKPAKAKKAQGRMSPTPPLLHSDSQWGCTFAGWAEEGLGDIGFGSCWVLQGKSAGGGEQASGEVRGSGVFPDNYCGKA
jgi:hypothetical protein